MTQPFIDNCLNCQTALYHDFNLKLLNPFCNQPFNVLCHDCQHLFDQEKLNFEQRKSICRYCQQSLDDSNPDPLYHSYQYQGDSICFDCKRWLEKHPKELLNNQSIFSYSPLLREWLMQFKTVGNYQYAYVMSNYLRNIYKKEKTSSWWVLPSSNNSLNHRQFHATGLLLDFAGIPYDCPFNYIGDGRKQAQKKRKERLEMHQPFQLIPPIKTPTRILLFDDLYTTGRTLLHAKQSIHQVYPECIIKSVTIARSDRAK